MALDLTRLHPNAGVRAWAGADRSRHDFRGAGTAIEVKTTLSATGYSVTIHGLEQLLIPGGRIAACALGAIGSRRGDGTVTG